MKRILVCVLLSFLLFGCSDNGISREVYNTVASNNEEVISSNKDYYSSAKSTAREYEMNAILSLTDDYSWNFLREGSEILEDETKSLGIYSKSSLESTLGVTKESVEQKIVDFTNLQEENKQNGLPVENLKLTKNERIVNCTIKIGYYFETSTNSNKLDSTKVGTDKKNRLIQVVTLEGSDFVCEQYFIWEDGSIVDYGKQGGIL